MVPFWRRRLLVVTLPALALATLVVIVLGLVVPQMARRPEFVLDAETASAALTLATPHLLVLVLTPLLLARVTHREALGPGFVLVAALNCVWMAAAAFVLTVGVGVGLSVNLNRSPWLVAVGLLAALAVAGSGLRRSGGVWPRTARAARLCITAAAAGAIGLCVVIPVLVLKVQSLDADSSAGSARRELAGLAVAMYAGLSLAAVGLSSSALLRGLTLRHAPSHARRCHTCGYDLLGTEQPTCPECDHPISPEQSAHLKHEHLA